jgi:hypothetical protein
MDAILNCADIFIHDSEALRETLNDLTLAQQTAPPPATASNSRIHSIFLAVAQLADSERDLPAIANAFLTTFFGRIGFVSLLGSKLPEQLFSLISEGLGPIGTNWALGRLFLETDDGDFSSVNFTKIFAAFQAFVRGFRDGGPTLAIAVRTMAAFACRLATPSRRALSAFADIRGLDFVSLYLRGGEWEATFLSLLEAGIQASDAVILRALMDRCADGPAHQPAVFNLLMHFNRYSEINALFPIEEFFPDFCVSPNLSSTFLWTSTAQRLNWLPPPSRAFSV